MYRLYGGKPTRSLMVEMVMAEGGLDFEPHFVDISRGEEKSADFLAINPAGWVPALVTPEGEVLYETPAINQYLAERHGLTQLVPPPGDSLRARFLCALAYLTGELEPALKRYWYPETFGSGADDAAVIATTAQRHVFERLAIIDARLQAAGPYHLGERYSLADLTLAYWVTSVEELEVEDRFEALARCCEAVTARPCLAPLFTRLRDWNREFRASG